MSSAWSWGGLITAALLLAAGEVIVSSDATSLLSLARYPAQLAAAWMDPSTPLIPQLATTTTTTSGAAGTVTNDAATTSPGAAAGNTGLATIAQPT